MNDIVNSDVANIMEATHGKGFVKRKAFKMNENTGTDAGNEGKAESESGTFSKDLALPKNPPKKQPDTTGNGKLSFDSVAKTLLKRTVILANVLKYGIEEFSQYDIAELQDCIEDVCAVNSIAVDPAMPNADSKIESYDTEDTVPGEGVTRFDILFNIRHPRGRETVVLTINIEVQPLDDDLNYKLISRCVYYAARLISRQNGTVFKNMEYDSIRKVYTLWLRPSLNCKNSMVELGLGVLRSFGPALELGEEYKQYYDKIRIAIITFGNKDPENREKIVEFLSALLIDDKTLEYRQKILEHEFNVPMTKEISEAMENMGSLSSAIMKEGREQGLAQGLAQGREEMRQKMQKELDDMNTKMSKMSKMQERMQEQMLASIKILSDSCGISYEEAMKRMSIPEPDQVMYLKRLRES
ncbi:hypothetical protein [Succinimonas sp.]|uniref:hypothetical protein n=1 Tax=Succinimonas sp. TaxID=1936151 RepID=UPI00386880BC